MYLSIVHNLWAETIQQSNTIIELSYLQTYTSSIIAFGTNITRVPNKQIYKNIFQVGGSMF